MFGIQRSPHQILFGAGQRFALGMHTRRLGVRALVCTDARLSADPEFARLLDSLHSAGVEATVFDETIAELPLECILHSAERGQASRPDVVIGIGGGSCLDIAKLTALLLSHGGRPQDYYGEHQVPGPVMPMVAMPTTAGTGSEVTPVAVMGDPARTLKVGISSPYLIPRIAICDPELTLSCPPGLTAVSGADALTHAIEAFTAVVKPRTAGLSHEQVFVGKNDLSDVHARVAIAAIAGHLRTAVTDGTNLVAREQMMLGALEAGLAFGAAGTAAAHAVQYPVGAFTGTAHGLGVAAMLPYVMAFNRPVCTREFAEVARLMGVAGQLALDELADAAIEAVATLLASVGIPRTLAELDLPEAQLPWVAEQALSIGRLVKNNPRPLDEQSMARLVRAAFDGDRSALSSDVMTGRA